ncbi:uncharacterized protein PAC_17839 [Phialocephala subalpina]|uniref:Clr5 domain-containing protein n=1 Tax=Phialocephala subalpina TaxID=576137 RepID=A0A1L7XSC8_9HELO|nr:uncharacterized protein PAC_17839 [Phialocephala subalpina]
MSQSSSNKATDHSPEVWELQKARFTQHYINEDRPLREVQGMMSSLYGFRATERQYKRKIAQWKLEKYIRDDDMQVVLRKQLKRKLEEGKESEVSVNGKPVPPQKMQRFVQRKRLTDEAILAYEAGTPSYITCRTPFGESQQDGPHDPKSPSDKLDSGDTELARHCEKVDGGGLASEDPGTLHLCLSKSPTISTLEISSEVSKASPLLDDTKLVQEGDSYKLAMSRDNEKKIGCIQFALNNAWMEASDDFADAPQAGRQSVPENTPTNQDSELEVSIIPDVEPENHPTQTALSPFEQRSARYWLSDSPSWYHQHITPGNPLYYLTPYPITSPYTTLGRPEQILSKRERDAALEDLQLLRREKKFGGSKTRHPRLTDYDWEDYFDPEKVDWLLKFEGDVDLLRKVLDS